MKENEISETEFKDGLGAKRIMSSNIAEKMSRFVVITGPRGSQKSLQLTQYAVMFLIKYFYLKRLHGVTKRVWTNYPVGFNLRSKLDGEIYHLESEPFNMDALYLMDNDLANGWAFIDEIDQWYDRQGWAETTQKLTSAALTQIRKSDLSIGATLQDVDWLNARGQFQMDILIGCREAAFTSWGRAHNLPMGYLSNLASKDISGVQTGYMYKETGRIFTSDFHGHAFWNCYNTKLKFNPMETKTKIKVKRPVKEYELTERGYESVGNLGGIQPTEESETKNFNYALLADIVFEQRKNGVLEVTKDKFWQLARERGFNDELWRGGQYLRSLGVEKVGNKGHKYSFENSVGVGEGAVGNNPPIPPKNNNTDESQPVVPPPARRHTTHSRAFKKKQLVKAGKK